MTALNAAATPIAVVGGQKAYVIILHQLNAVIIIVINMIILCNW